MSEINITNVIIHEIIKDVQGQPSVKLSASSIKNIDERTKDFIEKLCNIFKLKSLERAVFTDKSNFVNQTNRFTNYKFKTSTERLVDKLREQLVNATNAKGGFLVFFEYNSQDNRFFSIFLVRNTNGFLFEEKESIYTLASTEYIDLDNVAMGGRINVTSYLNQSTDRYITLVRGNTDIAEYFKNWIGIDRQESEQTDCKNLLEIARIIPPPNEIEQDELKRKIGEYAQTSPNYRITLSGLSEQLYGNSSYIQEFAESKNIDIDTEFTLKGKNLMKFFKISVKVDGINFSADISDFDSGKVKIAGNQIIITSENLVQKN